jgi:hypothetical protein
MLLASALLNDRCSFSTKETAHANSTGEQPGGDINRQQEFACGEVCRVRRQDVSQFTSEAASYPAPATAGIVGDRTKKASARDRAHANSLKGELRQRRNAAVRV